MKEIDGAIPIRFIWRIYERYRKELEYELYEGDEDTTETKAKMDALMGLIREFRNEADKNTV